MWFDQKPEFGDILPASVAMPVPDCLALRELPQFYRADFDMVWRLGGPVLRQVLDGLSRQNQGLHFRYASIDSRLSMLQQGMYPCIPGWHCDDFHRRPLKRHLAGGTRLEPDLLHVMDDAPAAHVAVVLGDCSLTKFWGQPIAMPAPHELPEDGRPVYAHYHEIIEKALADFKTRGLCNTSESNLIRRVLPGEFVRFGPLVWHRGEAAEYAGWRYFLRMTLSNHVVPQNEIRTQTQVYLNPRDPYRGW